MSPRVRRTSIPTLAFCLALAPAAAFGQSTQGLILGTVQDGSGAILPNAAITLTDTDTSVVFHTQADSSGAYQFPGLEPGHYTVHVEAAGFRSTDLQNLVLTARQQLRADAKLQVGEASQQVTVDASTAGTIETETASIASTLGAAEVLNLPANYRASQSGTTPLALIQSLPGVQPDTAQNNGTTGGGGTVGAFSVQGGLPFQTEITVDGISSQDATSNSPLSNAFTSGESIAEFRVDGVLNNAQFGQPGEITTVSKSGTNTLHGGIFWYHQNAAFNARPFGATTRPSLVGNDFGGTLGGPVEIPHLYHGKDRTFFFGTYEGFRLPHAIPEQYVVPTAAEKAGDFSAFATPLRNPFNPGTTYAGNQVPVGPVAQKFLSLFPDPNFSGPNSYPGGGNPNYIVNKSANQSSNQFDARVDQFFGQRALAFARYSWKNYNIDNPQTLLVPTSQQVIQNRMLVGAFNFTFTPRLINEFRAGFTFYNTGNTNNFNGRAFTEATGLEGLQNLFYNGIPELDFNTLTSLNSDRLSSITRSRTIQYLDTLSYQVGQHQLKFGMDLRHVEAITPLGFNGADNYGTFDFSTATFTGQEFADFLIGVPNTTFYDVVTSDNNGISLYTNVYAQDEWHARPNLVVSYGLRYEYHPAYHDPSGNIGNFNPAVAGSGEVVYPDGAAKNLSAPFLASFNSCPIGQTSGTPAANGVNCTPVLSNSQAGLPRGLRYVPTKRVMPRFSVAYRPFNNDRTVIRGGFGMYDITLLGSSFYSLTGTLQSNTIGITNATASGQPSFVWPNIGVSQASSSAGTVPLGQAYFGTANDINWKDPYSEQYALSLDRDLGNNFGLRLSYIGMETHHLVYAPNLNDMPYSSTTSAYYQPLSARPFPNWGRINTRSTGADESYHSGQIEVSHHLRSGLEFDSTYTFAKALADNEGPTAGGFSGENGGARASYVGDPHVDFGNVYGTRRHRWNTTVLYDLPVGRGRMFGSNMNRFADLLIGGWRTTNIFLIQSGPFLTPYVPAGQSDPSGTGSGLNGGLFGDLGHRDQHPDKVGNAKPSSQNRNHWINTAAFTCPGNPNWTPGTGCHTGAVDTNSGDSAQTALAQGYIAPIGRFGNAQNGSIVGPGTVNLSTGLSKVFPITERVNFRVEGTFTNVLNHTNLNDPSLDITKSNFGTITSARGSDFSGSRSGQVSARIDF